MNNPRASRRGFRGLRRARTTTPVAFILAVGVASTFLTTGSGVAAADKPQAVVSLGDSFISGEAGRWAGNGNASNGGEVWGTDRAATNCVRRDKCDHDLAKVYGDTPYREGNGCDRSDVAEIRGADIDGVPAERRFNLACSGAVTDNVTKTEFRGEKPQVEQLRNLAADYDITTIVLSISGNDLNFSNIIEACAKAYLGFARPCNETQRKAFDDVLPQVKDEVIDTVRQIQTTMLEAGYESDGYRMIVQSYPAMMPRSPDYRYSESGGFYSRYRVGGCPFLNTDADWANDYLLPSIRAMLHEVARTTDVSFFDLTDAFAGHELCAKSAEQATNVNSQANPLPAEHAEWVRWLPYLRFRGGSQGDQQEAFHPNAYGQQALSECLTEMVAASPVGGDAFSCTGEPCQGTGAVTVSRYGDEDRDARASSRCVIPDGMPGGTGSEPPGSAR